MHAELLLGHLRFNVHLKKENNAYRTGQSLFLHELSWHCHSFSFFPSLALKIYDYRWAETAGSAVSASLANGPTDVPQFSTLPPLVGAHSEAVSRVGGQGRQSAVYKGAPTRGSEVLNHGTLVGPTGMNC